MGEFGTIEYVFTCIMKDFHNRPIETYVDQCQSVDGYIFGGWWMPKHWLLPIRYSIFVSGMDLYLVSTQQHPQNLMWFTLEHVNKIRRAIIDDEKTIRAYLGLLDD